MSILVSEVPYLNIKDFIITDVRSLRVNSKNGGWADITAIHREQLFEDLKLELFRRWCSKKQSITLLYCADFALSR